MQARPMTGKAMRFDRVAYIKRQRKVPSDWLYEVQAAPVRWWASATSYICIQYPAAK